VLAALLAILAWFVTHAPAGAWEDFE
jgi:hypothetical protein